jgi:gliding motility-associated peptidyl-prolyl isomerase
MKKFKIIYLLIITILIVSCKQQQAREPISHSSGSYIQESAERNKKIIKVEEKLIQAIIKNDKNSKYIASQQGYWYKYEIKNDTDSLKPQRGDVAFFDYEVKDLKGNVIYSKEELKPQIYTVDKQNIMSGLRSGIKLMKKTEKITFLFPSHIAYGYHGDNDKISTNEPIICTVTLNDFKLQK